MVANVQRRRRSRLLPAMVAGAMLAAGPFYQLLFNPLFYLFVFAFPIRYIYHKLILLFFRRSDIFLIFP